MKIYLKTVAAFYVTNTILNATKVRRRTMFLQLYIDNNTTKGTKLRAGENKYVLNQQRILILSLYAYSVFC